MRDDAKEFTRNWISSHLSSSRYDLAPHVVGFLQEVTIEAFDKRRTEHAQLGLRTTTGDLSVPDAEALVMETNLEGVLNDLLATAADLPTYQSPRGTDRGLGIREGGTPILLIDVLEAINIRWCGIWPFCRGH